MLFFLSSAFAWSPLSVNVDCQSEERVDACVLVKGHLGEVKLVALVPLQQAQVVLKINATSEGTSDFVQLRAVGDEKQGIVGAPPDFAQVVEVDYRLSVDEQEELLNEGVERVLSPFLALAVPGSVAVSLKVPEEEATIAKTSPWGLTVWGGGWGSWSADYKSLSTWTGFSVFRKTNQDQEDFWINYDRSIELQPSLVVGEQKVALASDSSDLEGASTFSWNFGPHWGGGLNLGGGGDDKEGQYLWTLRARAGAEYNFFPSDDARGNQLAIAWLLGVQGDHYQTPNTLGQQQTFFPVQILAASGSVRFDTVTLSAELSARSQLYPFFQRYLFSAEVDTDLTLGDHVDLSLRMDATQQAIPGPASIDTDNYEEVTRASYAQPLSVQGHVSLRFHWDNTNSARNNRFETVRNLEVTSGL